MNEKDYFIGLDLGSASVGWAVVDEDYGLVKRRSKNLWGVNLFEEAKSAKERRMFRRSRRTINKRNWRLTLLKQEFKDILSAEDPEFLDRLRNSRLIKENKESIFFRDPDYKDVDYFREFPTIYHLRWSLMHDKEVKKYMDQGRYVRFLFLAINDILKSRGNFWSNVSVTDMNERLSIDAIEQEIRKVVQELSDEVEGMTLDEEFIINSIRAYMDHQEKPSNKRDQNTLLVKLLIGGYKVDCNKLFDIETEEKKTIDFEDELWEENKLDNDPLNPYLDALFHAFSSIKLHMMIGESESYSQSKIKIYDQHKKDLKQLKESIRKIDDVLGTDHYKHLFKDRAEKEKDKKASYTHYVGKYIEGDQKIRVRKKSKYAELIKKLVAIRKGYREKTGDDDLLKEIDRPGYLSIPNNTDNRLIPYQLHLDELKKMLVIFKDVSTRLGLEKNDTQKRIEHIERLLTFKVPYYAGPLSKLNNASADPNHWIQLKKEGVKITPYNFDAVVDKTRTNEAFIKRMIRNCTYLYDEDALQQETIAYQSYIFFNTINKIKINDHILNVEEKNKLFEVLAEGVKLTRTRILNILDYPKDAEVSGFSKDPTKPLDISLSSITKFRGIFSDKKNHPIYQQFYDDVVSTISLIDKEEIELRKKKIQDVIEHYSLIDINEDHLESLSKLSSKKRGNLSRKFLCEILFLHPHDQNGEVKTMLEWLKETNLNLMEVLYDSQGYNLKRIDKENKEAEDFSSIEQIHEYLKRKYIAPQARRPIIQALKIVDEIIKIMDGQLPKRIAIEFTREQGEKKETDSRYAKLRKLVEKIKDDKNLLKTLDRFKDDPTRLKSKKLYLYFIQGGKDLYTGKPIDIDLLLSKSDIYDIDHIYPQSKIKDDSLDNLVLTSSVLNGEKGNNYPISEDIRNKHRPLWEALRNNNLISSKKYDRLTRETELTEKELSDFVNRQKTTLDWVNLEIADILAKKYGKEKNDFIIFSKSRHVSRFRANIEAYKFRDLNNLHHAHDAYLNVLVGNTIKNHRFVMIDEKIKSNNVDNIALYRLEPFICDIKKRLQYYDPFVTKRTFINSSGPFWDQQMIGKKSNLIPAKEGMETSQYGGYSGAKTAFFTVIKDKRDKKKIIPIDTYECNNFYEKGQFKLEAFKEYIKKQHKAEVIYPMIPIQTKVEVDHKFLRIASGSFKDGRNGYHNIVELVLTKPNGQKKPHENQVMLRKVFRIHERIAMKKKRNDITDQDYVSEKITSDMNEKLFKAIISRLKTHQSKYSQKKLLEMLDNSDVYLEKFISFNIYKQCQTLVDIITKLLKSHGSNDCMILGLSFKEIRYSATIKYDFAVIKESITGFYTKREIIHSV